VPAPYSGPTLGLTYAGEVLSRDCARACAGGPRSVTYAHAPRVVDALRCRYVLRARGLAVSRRAEIGAKRAAGWAVLFRKLWRPWCRCRVSSLRRVRRRVLSRTTSKQTPEAWLALSSKDYSSIDARTCPRFYRVLYVLRVAEARVDPRVSDIDEFVLCGSLASTARPVAGILQRAPRHSSGILVVVGRLHHDLLHLLRRCATPPARRIARRSVRCLVEEDVQSVCCLFDQVWRSSLAAGSCAYASHHGHVLAWVPAKCLVCSR